jgi:hypothetical protein
MAVASRPFGAASRSRSHPVPSAAAPTSAFEIIELKPPNTVSFYLRVRASGALFLVVPARCPAEPRLWSVWVHRCLPGSVVDATQPPWISPERLRREDLAAAARAVHDDVDGWLKRNGQEALRRWVLGGVEQRS